MPDDRSDPVDAFWRTAGALRGTVIAWMSSRDVTELCGLHELLWRLDASRRSFPDDSVNVTCTGVGSITTRQPIFDPSVSVATKVN